jgi:hypothetical protein
VSSRPIYHRHLSSRELVEWNISEKSMRFYVKEDFFSG